MHLSQYWHLDRYRAQKCIYIFIYIYIYIYTWEQVTCYIPWQPLVSCRLQVGNHQARYMYLYIYIYIYIYIIELCMCKKYSFKVPDEIRQSGSVGFMFERRGCLGKWNHPDNMVHVANMGAIWGQPDSGGRHVGPMYLVTCRFSVFTKRTGVLP